MTDDDALVCWCGEEPAVPGSFLGLRCLPEPEPAPEDEAWQPSLWEAAAA